MAYRDCGACVAKASFAASATPVAKTNLHKTGLLPGETSHEMLAFIGGISSKDPETKKFFTTYMSDHHDVFGRFCHRLFGRGRIELAGVRAVYVGFSDMPEMQKLLMANWENELPEIEERFFGKSGEAMEEYLASCIQYPDIGPAFCKVLETQAGKRVLSHLVANRQSMDEGYEYAPNMR